MFSAFANKLEKTNLDHEFMIPCFQSSKCLIYFELDTCFVVKNLMKD